MLHTGDTDEDEFQILLGSAAASPMSPNSSSPTTNHIETNSGNSSSNRKKGRNNIANGNHSATSTAGMTAEGSRTSLAQASSPTSQSDNRTAAAAAAAASNPTAASSSNKKSRADKLFEEIDAGKLNRTKTTEEFVTAYKEATAKHPFVNKSHYQILIDDSAVFRDGRGNLVGAVLRQALPEKAGRMAADVLRPAATKTSLRANVFGGEAPRSGIAGYYDYKGAAVTLKCRKTSFTCDNIKKWPDVFPMLEYINALYKTNCPEEWAKQNRAIPDVVRIHGSVFSTLTINQKFRTARHTDAGDFDKGYGMLAILDGNYDGLHLGLPEFGVCLRLVKGDVLIFDTHHFHCNTEPEMQTQHWERMSCVFYYRANLGTPYCIEEYKRRLNEAREKVKDGTTADAAADEQIKFDEITANDNGTNLNRPSDVHPIELSPLSMALCFSNLITQDARNAITFVHGKLLQNTELQRLIFGCELLATGEDTDAWLYPQRDEKELESIALESMAIYSNTAQSKLGGFSTTRVVANTELIAQSQKFLNSDALRDVISSDLLEMWLEARKKWLDLVKVDWDAALRRNSSRTEFSWKNVSDMNKSFFELCDTAQEIKTALLGQEKGTPVQENQFWTTFASHLYVACEEELEMVKDAMSMRKLNVKLQDYNFGGTRYFKDQSSEEQQRRLARKKRLQEARQQSRTNTSEGGDGEEQVSQSWLDNDAFDYQTEDKPVDFEALGLPWPEHHVRSFNVIGGSVKGTTTTSGLAFPAVCAETDSSDIPTPQQQRAADSASREPSLSSSSSSSPKAGAIISKVLVLEGPCLDPDVPPSAFILNALCEKAHAAVEQMVADLDNFTSGLAWDEVRRVLDVVIATATDNEKRWDHENETPEEIMEKVVGCLKSEISPLPSQQPNSDKGSAAQEDEQKEKEGKATPSQFKYYPRRDQVFSKGRIAVTTVSRWKDIKPEEYAHFDLVVARHALGYLLPAQSNEKQTNIRDSNDNHDDDNNNVSDAVLLAATKDYFSAMKRLAKPNGNGVCMVIESDLDDRLQYVLLPQHREAFNAVRHTAFSLAHVLLHLRMHLPNLLVPLGLRSATAYKNTIAMQKWQQQQQQQPEEGGEPEDGSSCSCFSLAGVYFLNRSPTNEVCMVLK